SRRSVSKQSSPTPESGHHLRRVTPADPMVAALIPTPRSRCTSSRPRPRSKPTTRKRVGWRWPTRSDLARPSASFVRRRSTLALAVGLTGELRRSSSPAGRHTVRAAALRRAPHRALGDSGTVERAEARRARAPPTLLSGEIADELTVAVNTATSHV